MIRLHAVVEGQTEETFVNNVLAPELGPLDIVIDAHRVITGRMKARTFRGGLLKYSHLRKDLDLWVHQDRHLLCANSRSATTSGVSGSGI
jgi:hypothetical protein